MNNTHVKATVHIYWSQFSSIVGSSKYKFDGDCSYVRAYSSLNESFQLIGTIALSVMAGPCIYYKYYLLYSYSEGMLNIRTLCYKHYVIKKQPREKRVRVRILSL